MAKLRKEGCITQKNDASCIGSKRGMARRAKRNSSKRDRQRLKKEVDQFWDGGVVEAFDSYKVAALVRFQPVLLFFLRRKVMFYKRGANINGSDTFSR